MNMALVVYNDFLYSEDETMNVFMDNNTNNPEQW